MNNLNFYVPILKVDKEARTVAGYATTEAVDKQSEIVDYGASKAAFKEWAGAVREMHNPIAVGKAIEIIPDDETKSVYVKAYISKGAEDTWTKVKEGILTGFSIGGNTLDKSVQIIKDADSGKDRQITRITKYRLNELSLVDNPANPESTFTLVKMADDGTLQQTEVVEDTQKSADLTNDSLETEKRAGGESVDMDATLVKELTGKIDSLIENIGKLLKGEMPPELKAKIEAEKEKAKEDVTEKAKDPATSDLKTQETPAVPVKKEAEGEPTEKAKDPATSDLKTQETPAVPVKKEAEVEKAKDPATSDLKTQETPAVPVKKKDKPADAEDAADHGADEDAEDGAVKVAKSDGVEDLRKTVATLQEKIEKLEKEPLPRKYNKINKVYETTEEDTIQKDYDEVHAWVKANPHKDLPPELAQKRESLINKSLDRKFGGDIRKS
jgi:phage head maturation protease